MTLPPPRSTLFPYTSSSDLHDNDSWVSSLGAVMDAATLVLTTVDGPESPRSEEHTSELQSRPHLVCRLLLEKKKKWQPALEWQLAAETLLSAGYVPRW